MRQSILVSEIQNELTGIFVIMKKYTSTGMTIDQTLTYIYVMFRFL